MDLPEIYEKISTYCKEAGASEVILFGSRAKGTARERSDIDIAVRDVSDIGSLREKIDAIPTLITIDLINLNTCQNQFLLEDIQKYGRKI